MLARKIQTEMKHTNFIDRDPGLFEIILKYYRNGAVYVDITPEIIDEFNYYCIDLNVNVEKIDMNRIWYNTNENINNIIKLSDIIVNSDIVQSSLKNYTEIRIEIGPVIDSNKHYICFYKELCISVIKKYFKNKYNLKINIIKNISRSLTKNFLYYDLLGNKKNIIVENSSNYYEYQIINFELDIEFLE